MIVLLRPDAETVKALLWAKGFEHGGRDSPPRTVTVAGEQHRFVTTAVGFPGPGGSVSRGQRCLIWI